MDELERVKRNLEGFLRDSPDYLKDSIQEALFCIDDAIAAQKEMKENINIGDAVKFYFLPTDSTIYGIVKFLYEDVVDIEIKTFFNGELYIHILQDIPIEDIEKVS